MTNKVKNVQELTAEEYGVEMENTTKKAPKKKAEKIHYALDLSGVIDVLNDNNEPTYMMNDGNFVKQIVYDDKIYEPPPLNVFSYKFATKDEVVNYIKTPEKPIKLYKDLRKFLKSISFLPEEGYYDLTTLWVFHTYMIEKAHFSPIIYLYAVKERGKSRTMRAMLYASRRGIFTETIREPDILRWGQDHKASVGFDIKDLPKKIKRANCDDLFLARFERGTRASRTLYPEKGPFKDTKNFELFGPTIIATNRPVDDILESRSISIDMKPSPHDYEDPVTPDLARDLKNRLTAFRFLNQDASLIRGKKTAKGRLGDILSPLYSVLLTFFPEQENSFLSLIRKIGKNKMEAALDTFEAMILEAIIACESEVYDGFLATEMVTNKINEDKSDRMKLAPITIGRIIKSLGFIPRKSPTGSKRGIFYDEDLLARLKEQYGLAELDGLDGILEGVGTNGNGKSDDVNKLL